MSEHFDEMLDGLVETAARSASPPGAEAARRRGRQRRNRQRLAASALSLALMGGAGGIAAVSLGGGPQHAPTAAYTATPSASARVPIVTSSAPSPTGSASPSGSATHTAPPASTATTGAPSSNSAPAGGSQNTPAGTNPDVLVPAAWLSAAQMPFGSGAGGSWQAQNETPVGDSTALGDSVYETGSPVEFCTELTGGTGLTPLGDGASEQVRQFDGEGSFSVGGQAIPAYATQQILFYRNSSAAQSAWDSLSSDFNACAQQMTATSPTTGTSQYGPVQQTLDQGDAQCWSTLSTGTSTPSSTDGILLHWCFVRSGNLITAADVDVHQDGSFSVVGFGSVDPGLVSALGQALAVYNTGS